MKKKFTKKSTPFFLFLMGLFISFQTGAQVSGSIFQDLNANGVYDKSGSTKEVLTKNVLVKAYNAAGNLIAITLSSSTAASGDNNFSFNASGLNSIPSGTTVRLEFTNIGTGNYPSNSASGGLAQFVTAPASNVVLGLNYPKDYSQLNPALVTNLFVEGQAPAATGLATIVSVPYTASGTAVVHGVEAVHTQTGATWGLAWHRSSKTLFASAYQKRHTSYGMGNSTGVIYKLPNPTDGATTGVSVFLDLNTLFSSPVAGTNPHPNATANFSTDESSYSQTGKIAFGGMDVSDDEKSLWVVNLADRQLYNIPLGNDPLNPVAPTLSSQITRYPLYNKCDCNGNGSLDAIGDVDLRPFAVKAYRGRVYLGMVCSGQSTPNDFTKLKAFVFEFDPANGDFNQVLSFPLTYNRGLIYYGASSWYVNPVPGGYAAGNTANWRPWDDVYARSKLSSYEPGYHEGGWAQPILSDIAFDANGDMHLGLRDRYGDMVGDGVNEPGGSATLLESDAAGDILRATNTGTGAWLMNMTEATNGTEFYKNDNYSGSHDETCNGGLALIPGTDQIVYTVMDPFTNLSFGLDWANTTNGNLTKSYETNKRGNNDAAISFYFAKSNGNGDVEFLADAMPVEIGDRVWKDLNSDGLQDANEPGIANVTIQLFADFDKNGIPDGAAIGSVNTSIKGDWFFNKNNVADGDPVTAGNQPGLKLGSGYIARIASSDWNAAGGTAIGDLSGMQLTVANSSSAAPISDNDAILTTGATIQPQINIVAGLVGQNNFDYDFGFRPITFLAVKFNQVYAEKINNNAVLVKWLVANTEPGVVYTIEKSTNGTGFTMLGSVTGTTEVNYSFTDYAPVLTAKNYYRIKQTDANGQTLISEIRWVKFNSEIKMEIYPVPAVNNLHIVINNNNTKEIISASLYNMYGQKMQTQILQTGHNQLDVSKLATGTYQLNILEGESILETKKIIIQ